MLHIYHPAPMELSSVASGSLQTGKIVRFGPFEVNLLKGELRKHGIRLRLGPQAMQILAALLEEPGEIVTREELRRRLWADNTFVEFENGLNNAVNKLRSSLGDSAAQPLYVETLPREGYRFVAPLERKIEPEPFDAQAALVEPAPSAIPSREKTNPKLRRWVLGGCLVAAGVVAYGFLSPVPVPSATSSFRQPISEHFDAFAHIVTDGARVYFLERNGDRHNLVQTSAAGGPVNPVAAPFRNTRIFDVSPDHTEFLIGNFDAPRGGLPLWIWPVQGGSPVRVGDVTADDASWAPNGQIFYGRGNEIHLVARDGSGDRLLIHTVGRPYWIRFSPDGRKMTFSVDNLQSDEQTLWEAAADGSNPHLRFPGWSTPPSECCGGWTPDGKYLVFTSSHAGLQNMWAIREERSFFRWRSPVPVQLTPAAPPVGEAVLTRNGTRAFVVTPWNEAWQFERYDFSSGSFRGFAVLPGAFSAQPSRDGANFAVVKQDWTLWRTKADGSEPLQLTASPLEMTQPQWSPDGTQIAFEAHTPGKLLRVYVVNAAGGPVQEVLREEGTQGVPAWSPDGTQIAVAVNVFAPADSKLPRGIYVVDWKTRRGAKVPNSDGLTSPMWSPDGKYFIAKTPDERAILMFDSRAQTWKTVAKGTELSGLTWSRDSQYLYVQKFADEGQPIYRLHAGDFRPERVVNFEGPIHDGFELCVLEAGVADGSLIVRLRSNGGQIYALDLKFP